MTNGIGQYQGPSYTAIKVPPNNTATSPSMEANYSVKEAKQDAVKTVENSWLGSILKGIGGEGMTLQKAILCLGSAAALVFGVSGAMHKFTKAGIFKMGGKLDDVANAISSKMKNHKGISNFAKNAKNISTDAKDRLMKIPFFENMAGIFKKDKNGRRNLLLQPLSDFVRPMLRGTKNETVDNLTDALVEMHKKGDLSAFTNALKTGGLDQKGVDNVTSLIEKLNQKADLDTKFDIYDAIKNPLKKFYGFDKKGKDLISALSKDIVDNKQIHQKVHGFDVEVGHAFKKIMLVNGETSNTWLGRLLQKGLFRGSEAVSNGVASRSVMGYGIGIPIYFTIMNKVFSAPKGEKGKTFADEAVSDMGAYMLMPVTGGLLYGGLSASKYAGVSPDKVKTFKNGLKDLTETYAKNIKKAPVVKNTSGTLGGAAATGFKNLWSKITWPFVQNETIKAANKITKTASKDGFKALKKGLYENQGWFGKILSAPGKILSMGLETQPHILARKSGLPIPKSMRGFAGGAARFALFMFLISPLLTKPVQAISRKIFGKTTAIKEEEAKAKAEKEAKKAAKNNPQPQINMTQEELVKKLSERPELMARLQSDPKLLAELQKDPTKLIQLINEAPASQPQTQPASGQTPQGAMSPAMRDRLKNQGAAAPQIQQPQPQVQPVQAQAQATAPQASTPVAQQPAVQQTQSAQEPQRSYIPSSKAVATNATTTTPEQQGKLNDLYSKADKAEAEAMKYL